MRRLYAEYAVRAAAEGWAHRDYLALLVAEEVAHRNDKRIEKAARKAQFPFTNTVENLDFVFQSSLRRRQLGPYLGAEFVSEGRNPILTARFALASDLINDLGAACRAGRLREAVAAGVEPHALVIDEVGYLNHADDAANVLFGVVDGRYIARKPMIFTTNKKLRDRGQVLHDRDLAGVILDRVLERGEQIVLGGRSWCTRHLDPEILGDDGTDPESVRKADA
jgi:DNA replication protein DnaC